MGSWRHTGPVLPAEAMSSKVSAPIHLGLNPRPLSSSWRPSQIQTDLLTIHFKFITKNKFIT